MIYRAIQRHAEHTPQAIALRHAGGVLRYGGFAAEVRAAAAMLAAQGFGHGDRIGFIGHNHPAQLVLLVAFAGLGCVQVPLNWRLSAPELRDMLEDAEAVALFARPEMRPLAEEAAPAGCLVLEAPESFLLEAPESFLLEAPESFLPEAAESCAPAAPPPELPAEPEDPLMLVYTSGSTGRPKGVPLDQRALLANAMGSQHMFGLAATDRVLTVLPLFHVGGLNIQTLPALLQGAEVILQPRFDSAAFFAACAAVRPTLTLLVPTALRALVDHPGWASADLSSLRATGIGAAEVPLALIEACHERGLPVQQVYGATETGPIAIYQRRAEALANPGALGFPALHGDARVVDAAGRPVAAEVVGEIELRGPHVARGYWNRPEETAAAWRDGWFATGDLGLRDGAGRFWFAGRLKHLIISGGENIDPAELERVLRAAPGIAECAVCGRADPHWGEVPVAVVVPGPGYDPAAVLAFCATRLARFKRPRALVAVPALPRTTLGKLRLEALRRLAALEG